MEEDKDIAIDFTADEINTRFPASSKLEQGVDEDDNYEVFGDAEWLRASSRLKEELGSGKEMKNASEWQVDPEVDREAGPDNFEGSLDDIKMEQFDVDTKKSSFLMEKALGIDAHTFDDDHYDLTQGLIDEEDQYEGYEDEDYETEDTDFDEEDEYQDDEEYSFFDDDQQVEENYEEGS